MWSLNLGSLHTTAVTLTAAISMLSAEPDKYIPPLRAEIEEHCPYGQLSKTGLDKCVKLDSFLRETCRFNEFAVGKKQHRPVPRMKNLRISELT
jgi:hypothetical protein